MSGEFHGIDREFDMHIALHPAPSAVIQEFLGWFGDDGVAVVIEPVEQGSNRRILLILNDRCVIKRSNEISASLHLQEELLVINVEAKCFGSCIDVGAVDKNGDLV